MRHKMMGLSPVGSIPVTGIDIKGWKFRIVPGVALGTIFICQTILTLKPEVTLEPRLAADFGECAQGRRLFFGEDVHVGVPLLVRRWGICRDLQILAFQSGGSVL